MGRRSKTRWVLKWTGTLLLVVILGLFIPSLWWDYGYYRSDGSGYAKCIRGEVWWLRCMSGRLDSGWRANGPFALHFALSLPAVFDTPWLKDQWFWAIRIPLWLPFAVVTLPTACLWWRDYRRRIPPGHCQKCGYNLTGNVSGRCPECATPVPARSTGG